jgi:hypothetical protein
MKTKQMNFLLLPKISKTQYQQLINQLTFSTKAEIPAIGWYTNIGWHNKETA